LCAAADGQTLISGGYDGVLLWHDVPTGLCLKRVAAHKFLNWQLALSPDGKRLATTTGQYLPGGWKYEPAAETEPSVKIFDTASGERLAAFSHTPPVTTSCAFSRTASIWPPRNMMGEVSACGIYRLMPKRADGAVDLAGLHFVGHNQIAPLLRRNLRPRRLPPMVDHCSVAAWGR